MSIEIKIPADFDKIDVNDLGVLIWWSNHLEISPERILTIIDNVGTSVVAIKQYKRLNGNS